MVSNAREDLPEPDRPVMTTNLSLGIEISIFFKLCSLAPFITMYELPIKIIPSFYIKTGNYKSWCWII